MKDMKKIKALIIIPFTAIAFCSCMGDHGSQQGKDTEKNIYGAAKDTGNKADSLPTDTTGIDNSASGGTKTAKPDSSKK
jgi:hypothetical protein